MYVKLSIPEKLKDLRVERRMTLWGGRKQKNHPNTALHELHLSDDMIDVLKEQPAVL